LVQRVNEEFAQDELQEEEESIFLKGWAIRRKFYKESKPLKILVTLRW
jgi:hypothetical protein